MRHGTSARPAAVTAILAILTLLAAVVSVPALAPRASAAAAPGSISLDFEDGTLGSWSANGSPTLTYGADPADAANQVLTVTGRTQGYFGIQSPVGAFAEGVEYTVTARVRTDGVSGAAHFTFNEPGASNEYSWVGNTATGTAGEWQTVTGTFTPGANASSAKLYVEVEGLLDYSIDDITIVGTAASTCAPDASLDFEDGTLGSWSANGSPTLTYGADPADAANQVLTVTGRTQGYFGIQSPVGAFAEGVEYTVTAKVRTNGVNGAAHFTFNEPGASNEYSWVGNTATGTAGEWQTVTGTFTPGANASSAKLYVEVEGLLDYSIDDVVVTHDCTGSGDPEPCVPTATTHTTLDFEDGTLGSWSANGSPTLTYGADPADAANQVLTVTGRTQGYFGIQSPVGAFAEGVEYTVTARVRTDGVSGAAHFTFNEPGASNEYSWVGNTATGTAGEWQTVTGTFTPGANASSAKLYVEVEGLLEYSIDDITITYLSACAEGPVPGTVVVNADFEDGTLQGWEPRVADAGAHTVGVTTDEAHGGTHAALVSDRTSQGSGIGLNVDGLLLPGQQYELTAWVRFLTTPTDRIDFTAQTGASTFTTLGQFPDVAADGWTKISTKFSVSSGDRAFIYFETKWSSADAIGNTTPFLIDDIEIKVPDAVAIQDLTPIKDTVDFNAGVAIDQRETVGAPSQLLLKHFNQITPENYMKPEAWYDAEGNWAPNSAQIDPLMDFAKANGIGVYGHVLVWHSQTPDWFFKDGDRDLTNSDADKVFMRERLHTHIRNVAHYLSQWGAFGDDNPIKAFDVVNEVVNDGASESTNGLRNSRWYQILGEEFIADAFRYAEEEFNGEFAAPGAQRPVKLFINDYNTEQSGKRDRYLALVDRLLAAEVPIDGIGHQFHVSLATPVSALDEALTDASGRGLVQAVTEFDAPTGTPTSAAKYIDQGYYYRDAFQVFRSHHDLFSVTVWGLNDSRSWRNSSGGPLVFNDSFQAKPAYFGIVEPSGLEDELPARQRTANSFQGTVPATPAGVASGDWKLLPLLPVGDHAGFQTRWATDHLTVYVQVADATDTASDAVTVQVGDQSYTLPRDGGSLGAVVETPGGYSAVVHVPLASAVEGNAVQLDVRVTDGVDTAGWNSPGVTGTVTLVEPLSHVDVPQAAVAPVIDGTKDAVWSTASTVQTLKQVQGTGGAIGTFHVLWKDQTLYVYAQVADPTVDTTGSDPWIQDSVEIYVDGGNAKNGSYRYDDTQIRISADGAVSFGTGDEPFQAGRLQSSAKRVAGGYVVEAAISLLAYGGLGSVQGLDVQVNDATDGARTAIRNWAEPTGTGYQTTERWGVASLVAASPVTQPAFTPVIKGSAVVGTTLSVTGLPTGTTLTYQWLRNGAAISGATKATYKLGAADAGKRISVRVTSSAAGMVTRTQTSAATAVVLKTFTKVKAPTITGAAKVGHRLTAKVPAWSPVAKFTYQWYSNGMAIKGATKSTFTPTRKQAGTTITVKVTGSKSGYKTVAKVSAGKKVPLLKLTTYRSGLHGLTKVGGTLRVTPGASRPVATTKTYQWYVNGKAVKGATKSTYLVKAADKGKRITAKVTYRAQGFATKVVVVGPSYRIAAR